MSDYMQEEIKAFLRQKHRATKDHQVEQQVQVPHPSPAANNEEKSVRASLGQVKYPQEEMGGLSQFLKEIGLEKLEAVFEREDVDLESLQLLREEDYKDMGIKTGPRLKLLNALGRLHPSARQSAQQAAGPVHKLDDLRRYVRAEHLPPKARAALLE